MSGPWEKYVEKAAEAIDPAAFDPSIENHAGYVRQFRRDKACGQARVALAAVGPLIQEDTRERMVAAAGAALEREGGAGLARPTGGWTAEDVDRLHAKGRCTERAEHHHYTDSTGIHWVHQGPVSACSAPECDEAQP